MICNLVISGRSCQLLYQILAEKRKKYGRKVLYTITQLEQLYTCYVIVIITFYRKQYCSNIWKFLLIHLCKYIFTDSSEIKSVIPNTTEIHRFVEYFFPLRSVKNSRKESSREFCNWWHIFLTE